MNSAIETELRTLLDNVNKTLALNMSTKHGLDYDEVYEFLTVSMNENKAPSSRGRPKKEKKTITENHKDSTGKPDVNYIIKEIMEKDAELELSEDEIDGDAGEETSVLASSPKSSKKDKTEKKIVEKTEKKEKPKVEKTEKKEKPKVEKDDDKSKADKAAAAEKVKADKAAAAEKVKADKAAAAEKVKIEKAEAAEKAKADKAAAKAAAKTTTDKKPKGKGKEKEKTEVAVEASAADTDAADEDDDEGMNVCEHIVDGKTYLREEFGTKLYDPETNEEIGDWDEKNNKIIKA